MQLFCIQPHPPRLQQCQVSLGRVPRVSSLMAPCLAPNISASKIQLRNYPQCQVPIYDQLRVTRPPCDTQPGTFLTPPPKAVLCPHPNEADYAPNIPTRYHTVQLWKGVLWQSDARLVGVAPPPIARVVVAWCKRLLGGHYSRDNSFPPYPIYHVVDALFRLTESTPEYSA